MSKVIAEVHKLYIQKQSPGDVCKNSVLRNFAKFVRKHLCQSVFFKVAGTPPVGVRHKK